MLRVIRRGVFETNSSSTHSLTLCKQEEYDKWESGELLLCINTGALVTKEEALRDIRGRYPKMHFKEDTLPIER